MADKINHTFSSISNVPKTTITEVRVNGHQPDLDPLLIKLDTLTSSIIEGFKKDSMAAAMEVESTLSAMNQTIAEKIDDLGHAITTISDCVVMSKDVRDLQESLDKFAGDVDYKLGKIADNIKALDIYPLVEAIKSLNLKAEIPITSVTVGLPRIIPAVVLLSPFLWGAVIWILLHFTSR